jgi:large subunit ribosomal protein L31
MKQSIHPKYYSDAKVFVGGQEVYTVGSTKPEIHLDVWSGTHPFWTGTQRIVDSEKLADKFEKKVSMKKSGQELNAKKAKMAARIERAKEIKSSQKITLKDMLKGLGK